jgi:hypothetical protein
VGKKREEVTISRHALEELVRASLLMEACIADIRYQNWPTLGLGIGLTAEALDLGLIAFETALRRVKRQVTGLDTKPIDVPTGGKSATADLLAACKAILTAFESIPEDVSLPDEINMPSEAWDLVKAAIEKAEPIPDIFEEI